MKKIMNITTSAYDLPRYGNNSDLKDFYHNLGLDGVEVMRAGEDASGIIRPEDVAGVHLKFFASWMDIWIGDRERLIAEYDNWTTCEQVYGGSSKDAIVEAYRRDLDFAASFSPEYLVFHVAECTLEESVTRQFRYADKRVIDATIDLINRIVPFIQGSPFLLFENLWYPGLTMLRPKMVKRLLDGIDYPKKGVMLDVGHLLHTNTELTSLAEGLRYAEDILDRYDDLSFIRGIHLHQTLSGQYAERIRKEWRRKPRAESYHDRLCEVLPHIYQIDSHQPYSCDGIRDLVSRISPEYLVLEQISRSREEHEKNIREQLRYL